MNFSISDATKLAHFTTIFANIDQFTQYIKLAFTPSGLTITQDVSQECETIMDFCWCAAWFNSFAVSSDTFNITIPAGMIQNCLLLLQPTQTAHFVYNADTTNIDVTLSDGNAYTIDFFYTIQTMSFSADTQIIPTKTYELEMTLYASNMKSIMSNLILFGENVIGNVSQTSIELSASSPGQVSMRVAIASNRTFSFVNTSADPVVAHFNTSTCIRACLFSSMSPLMNMKVSKDSYMLLAYSVESGLIIRIYICSNPLPAV